ncbi:MAG: rhodanese-like domain-containing protein [Phycisphaerales bacterium]|nr:rhodanese-like domain-containing protein [Planctomycetota bacterium]
MFQLFCRIFAIIGLGVTVGAADSWLRPTRLSLEAPPAEAAQHQNSGAPGPAELGLMIDAASAKKLFDEGVVFLDARIDEEFAAGHIPQAFHLNSATFGTPAGADAMQALDPSQRIVIYCGGGECDASKNLALLLQGAGYKRTHIFEAGFPEWIKQGYPVEKSKP